MADDSGEKTEDPTGKKLEKAREEGQVAKSMELASAFIVLNAAVLLYISSSSLYKDLLETLRQGFSFGDIPDVNATYCINFLSENFIHFLLILLPIFGVVFVTAFLLEIMQVGFEPSFELMMPKLEKLNFIKGFGRLLNVKSIVELAKSIIKMSIIAIMTYSAIVGELKKIFMLHDGSVSYILLYMFKVSFKIVIWVALAMVVVAILDYAYQKFQFNKEMKMSKQEVKDEFKQTEGDPLIKSKIRSMQMETAKKRMMQEVPKADVVVTNPTHLAIAIKYDPVKMKAPKVLAKGAGLIAEKIKEIAKKHNIPVIENKELAQKLYKVVDIDQEVPGEFYVAIAQLLAYVYKLKGKK
ncbi:MAG: flagellar biosynthesis protein FlhB [Desulfobacterales bacterium]|nr:flagellar biosynthesis protein FlhB [Desulfobacterales bacterium]